MKIKSIKKIKYSGPVYNLSVEDNNNYFANDILVHNCHHAKANSIQTIAKKCTNAEYRLGFTGTVPTAEIDKMNIFGYLGQQLIEIKSRELIEKGILSEISVANLILKYPVEIIEKYFQFAKEINPETGKEKWRKADYSEEEKIVELCESRNLIFNWIFSLIPDKQNTLILCKHIDHLKSLEEYLIKNLPDKFSVYIIYGGVEAEEREKIRLLVNTTENVILLGTYATLSTGINIPKLHNCIFASSYKSKIKIIQSIGRGLRTHESKERLIVWDVIDDLSYLVTKKGKRSAKDANYLFKHFLERLKYYQEQEFKYFSKEIYLTELEKRFHAL